MTKKNNIKLAMIGLLALLMLIILLQNTETVSFRVLFWELTMSRIIMFPLIMLAGIVIGVIIGKKITRLVAVSRINNDGGDVKAMKEIDEPENKLLKKLKGRYTR